MSKKKKSLTKKTINTDIYSELGFKSYYDAKELDLKRRTAYRKNNETTKDKWSRAVSEASDGLSFIEGVPESISHSLNVADILLDPSWENIRDNAVEYGIDAIKAPMGGGGLIDATLGTFWYGHKIHLDLRNKGGGWVRPASAPSIAPSDNTRVVKPIIYFKK